MNFKILLIVVLVLQVYSKGKSPEKIKREECEKLEICKYDDTDNCTLRCMSEKCYLKVYGNDELEAGEIQRDKAKLYTDCFRIEEKEIKNSRYK